MCGYSGARNPCRSHKGYAYLTLKGYKTLNRQWSMSCCVLSQSRNASRAEEYLDVCCNGSFSTHAHLVWKKNMFSGYHYMVNLLTSSSTRRQSYFEPQQRRLASTHLREFRYGEKITPTVMQQMPKSFSSVVAQEQVSDSLQNFTHNAGYGEKKMSALFGGVSLSLSYHKADTEIEYFYKIIMVLGLIILDYFILDLIYHTRNYTLL